MGIDPADGRPWILVPGTLCTGKVFGGLLDALGVPLAARHVVDLCHPCVDDYLADLNRRSDPRAIVCGFSLGAIVAAHLADRVKAAEYLLFGLNPHADDPAKREGRLDLARDVARTGGAAALAARLGPLAGPDPAGARRLILAMAEDSANRILAQTHLALGRPGALGALSRAGSPVTLLTGDLDTHAPVPLAQAAAQATPQGRLVLLPGLGHYALVEDPVACAAAVAGAWGHA